MVYDSTPKNLFTWRIRAEKLWTPAVFTFLTITFFTACENTNKEIKDLAGNRLGVEQAEHVNINYTLGGKAKATLLSALMLRVQDTMPYVEFPKKLHVDFYNDTSGVDSRLEAFYGKYFESQSRVLLKDSIRITNIKGDTLYCNELWWDRSKLKHEFYTDKPVKIRTRTQIIDGIGMESAQDFKNWVILHPVGFINVPTSQFPAN